MGNGCVNRGRGARVTIYHKECLRVESWKGLCGVESNSKITEWTIGRKRKRAPLMAIAWKKRLHRNYCTIVIPSHPCQLVQPFCLSIAAYFIAWNTPSIEYLERRAHTTMDGNNTANKIKTLLFPFPLRSCAPVNHSMRLNTGAVPCNFVF